MKKGTYKILKDNVEMKLGKKIVRSKDCSDLSLEITKKTGRHVSISTIKRFFGIVKSPFKPSIYTLDTLVKYIGYDNWHEYIKSEGTEKSHDSWDIFKASVHEITDYSLVSIKLRTAFNPKKVIYRSFITQRFEKFLNSPKSATLFLAPDGFGKSVALIQLFEKYFQDEDAPYKNDIVLLIDGGIFFNLYSKNVNNELLSQLVDFKIHSSPEFHFQKYPEQRKGRFWLIIDNVDEIFFGKEKYHELLENLMRIIMAFDNNWYKLIFTCRPENLDVFTYLTNKNPLLKSSLFEVEPEVKSHNEAINIPLLGKDEIEELGKKLGVRYNQIKKNKNLINLLRNPSVFMLYANMCEEIENVSEFELIRKFLEKRLYAPPYMEVKLHIIDSFIGLCINNRTNSVKKEALLSDANYSLAYQELISYGILYESLDPAELFEINTIVKFREKLFFNFVLLEKWMQSSGPDINLFHEILHQFENDAILQCDVLEFFVRYMICRKEFDLVKQIRTEIHDNKVFSSSGDEICGKSILSFIKEELSYVT